MRTYLVDSFTDVPFKGNPAAVCLVDEKLPATMMLDIARELGLSETAFLEPIDCDHYGIRYFSPKTEIPLCGHATLAAATVVFELAESIELQFITIQELRLRARQYDGAITMQLPAYETQHADAPTELLAALGIDSVRNSVFNAETRILLLEIESPDVLGQLTPDFPALYRSHDGINGVVVTAASANDEFDFHSRYFWPWSGTDEDPVTGGTHTFLAPYWSTRLGKKKLRSFQSSARSGSMDVELFDDGKIAISGKAVIVLSGQLHL